MKATIKRIRKTKHYFSASGSLLLPLALKWGLAPSLALAFLLPVFTNGNASATSIEISFSKDAPLTLDVTPTEDGAFKEGQAARFTVKSDAYFGYELTVSTKSEDGSLRNEAGDAISSIAQELDVNTFKRGAEYNNQWGFKPNKYNGETNSKSMYYPAPTASQPIVLDRTTSAPASEATSYTIGLGARVDSSLAAGVYEETFIITATATSVPYDITYDANGGENAPERMIGSGEDVGVTLSEQQPTNGAHIFLGWCTQKPRDLDSDSSRSDDEYVEGLCAGDVYQPGMPFPPDPDKTETTLYAVWFNEAPTNMQDFTPRYCSLMPLHSTLTLTDDRGGVEHKYRVRKLRDGNCWMIDNLALGGNTTITLTPKDSDVSKEFPLPASIDNDFTGEANIHVHVESDAEHGGYYSWLAATAGSQAAETGGDAPDSICPRGWRLPTGGTNGELQAMTVAYTGLVPIAEHLQDETGADMGGAYGYYFRNNLNNKGDYSRFWSSTDAASSTKLANYLGIFSDKGVSYDLKTANKALGNNVRCVARKAGGLRTMQNVSEWASTVEQGGDAVTALDIRDGNTYTVARLNDGKLWMTQNLRIGSSIKQVGDTINLDSATSDISGDGFALTLTAIDFSFSSGGVRNFDADAAYIDSEYGGYYSWHTATAGTGSSTMETDGENAPDSICPKGWRLLTGGPDSEYYNLIVVYGGAGANGAMALRQEPIPGFTLGGRIQNNGDGLYNEGKFGDYWSSTVAQKNRAYRLHFDDPDNIHPYAHHDLYGGLAVRCIARE